jgi:hypothetical protein
MNMLMFCEHCNEHLVPIIFWVITSFLDDPLHFQEELSFMDIFTPIAFSTAASIFIPHNNVVPPHESTCCSLH